MRVANNEIDMTKNAGELMTILTTMRMQRCDALRIARWSTTRASLEANGCHHQASACIALPRRPPWSTILNKTHKTQTKHKLVHIMCAQLFNELRDLLITFLLSVCWKHLIARNDRELFSSNCGISYLNKACCIDNPSRGSVLGYEILTNN